MSIDAIVVGLIITCIIITILGFALASFALIKVMAMEKSTHTMAWKDPFAEEEINVPSDEEMSQRLSKELDQHLNRQEEPSFQYEKDVIS